MRNNKVVARALEKALKEQGHDVKLGHIYEALAKAVGYASWNVASAKYLVFENEVEWDETEE